MKTHEHAHVDAYNGYCISLSLLMQMGADKKSLYFHAYHFSLLVLKSLMNDDLPPFKGFTQLLNEHNTKEQNFCMAQVFVVVFEVLCGTCSGGILILRQRNLNKLCLLKFLCLNIQILLPCALCPMCCE